MTRAHEQAGLRKPAHRAAQMRTVNCKDLELIARNPPHPACRVYRLAVARHDIRIAESSQPRLAFGKFADATEGHPRKVGVAAATRYRRKQISHDWQCKGRCH